MMTDPTQAPPEATANIAAFKEWFEQSGLKLNEYLIGGLKRDLDSIDSLIELDHVTDTQRSQFTKLRNEIEQWITQLEMLKD